MMELEKLFSGPAGDLDDFCALAQCQTEKQIESQLLTITHKLGMEYYLYGARFVIDRNKSIDRILTNYSSAWRQKYEQQNYIEIDPVISHVANRLTPLIWRPETYSRPDQTAFFEEARAFGLAAGISYPVHGRNGDVGVLSFAVSRQCDDARKLLQMNVLHGPLIVNFVHQTMQSIVNKPGVALTSPLTKRELECLKWVASGKSTWEISRILGISEHGVVHHVRNMMSKFNVSCRHQAVVRASFCGLI
ncbi:helix-turn-helix transcriptional regulator [Janthinobacterium fluminis]|uniref:LuxR family transcriptional regulator n=1 Tax=Janthinobacterium fluminis TaxID=2987524 RepID=A0ABT5K1S1_9BURK|nr:LuxR family transcriptional regulator [Janthinobacterium fluminis]MDC8758933.1 LuxR family transcriptional regulator [Janthinobacterium fluminis]